MSRKYRSIAIAIAVIACLLLAPASAWAGPVSAHTTMTAEAPSVMQWLEAVWARVLGFAQPRMKTDGDNSGQTPPTESGASIDPWG